MIKNVSFETELRLNMKPQLEKKTAELLAGTRLFKETGKAVLNEAVKSPMAQLHEFSKGQRVFPCRGIKRALGVIVSGSCRVSKGKLIISTLPVGSLFGAVTLYNDSEDFVTDIIAAEDCKVFFMRRELLDELIDKDPSIAKNYIAYLSERIYFLNGKLDMLISGSGEEKLARYLLERERNEKGEVELPLNISKFAQQLGIGRASLYRAFDRLNSAGAIAHNGKAICILDDEKLKSFTNE